MNERRWRGLSNFLLSLKECHSAGIFLLAGDTAERLKGFLRNDKEWEASLHALLVTPYEF